VAEVKDPNLSLFVMHRVKWQGVRSSDTDRN